MPNYGVYVTFKQTAYVEVEADNEEEAQDMGYELIVDGKGAPCGSEDDYDIEVEEL